MFKVQQYLEVYVVFLCFYLQLDALSDKKIENFNDIRDGVNLITILKSL